MGTSSPVRLLAAGWILLLVLQARPAFAAPCVEAEACTERLQLSTGKYLRYHRSFPVSPNEAIERVVIVIHGLNRNADDYFERLVSAAGTEDRLDDTLLIAPRFITLEDQPASDEHFWSRGGWKKGSASHDDPGRLSSFAAMNELLDRVCSTTLFPRLRDAVLVGHSAGGQFVNRYLAGGAGCRDPEVELRYVVMNPSSYLYASNLRRSASGEFEIPQGCPEYDEYHYGLQDLNDFMDAVGASTIRHNLFSRPTHYLAGDEDNETGEYLDTSCSGNAQGPNRLARHENYSFESARFEEWTGSAFERVPGVGHSSSKMLKSDVGRRILFRYEPDPDDGLRPHPPVLLDD